MIETVKIGTLRWHHVISPDDSDLEFLRENFHFHPLDLEDCRSPNQRPKIDIYDDYYFMILHFPNFDRTNTFLTTKEVKVFWGEDYVITIGQSHWVVAKMFDEAKEQQERKEPFEVGTSDALLYRILEKLMQESLSMIRRIGSELDFISQELFSKRAVKTIEEISVTRKNIILLNTIFKPALRLFHKFETGAIKGFAENMEDYWGNILDYYQKMWDMTEDYEELIEGFSKTFDSLQANRINEIIKVLTLISSILLPLTFITGLYGMNVGLPFQNHPNSFWIVLGCMLLIASGMLAFFRKKKWL
ncbi:MAG: magnesium transporter CorA family protein [Bacteroidales bacterium]|nr:magnesium transporter CorA family protein [Bacteroidales bacterium]MCF8345056.1 magnesium transporter CorA family protein [Bacteroidales bacterium]MCF8352125.1 magnesium transporter CorA family protein [Bacteroidales bacterium]